MASSPATPSIPARPWNRSAPAPTPCSAESRPLLHRGDVALVAHGHLLRVLTARWLGLAPAAGRLFRLDTGTFSTLGTEHAEPVISSWNIPPSGPVGAA